MDNLEIEKIDKKKLILIDGNGLAYRAFYALPPLKTSQGEPVNAVYGFTNMLLKIIEREKPDFAAVAFDKSRPTVRIEQFDEYKAHRQRMPEELQMQFPIIEEVVRVFRIPVYHAEGYEADDCIATLSNAAHEKQFFTKIYSGDLDMLQLVNEDTRVVTTRRGISDLVVYDNEMVKKRYQIDPSQLVDYKALAGDSSDHIPGIPGIGEASASKLLNQFRDIESMYENPANIPSRWKKQILENKDQAYLSKKLVSLEKNMDINIDWDELSLKDPNREELKRLFIRLEFKTLLKKLGFKEEEMEEIQEISVSIVGKDEDLDVMMGKLKAAQSFSIFWVADEQGDMVGLSVGEGTCLGYYFPFMLPEQLNISSTFGISTFSRDRIIHEFKPLLDNPAIRKYIYNLKEGIKYLKRSEYFSGKNFIDLNTASFLISPDEQTKNIEDLMAKYSEFKPKTLEEILSHQKNKKKMKIIDIPLQDLVLFIAGRAVRVNNIGPVMLQKLEKQGLADYFFNLEMALTPLLAAIEAKGIKIDREALLKEQEKYQANLDEIAGTIYRDAGKEFNINSTRQLGNVLFEGLKLPAIKSGSGYKTGADVLEKIIDEHPIIEKILKYREMAKMKSGYVDSLLEKIDPSNDKIYTRIVQTNSTVGRIQVDAPRLKSLPVEMRHVFIPSDPEKVFLKFDYSQLDMVLLAHFCQDENLIKGFIDHKDFHSFTASMLFDVPIEKVTDVMRETAKEINYSYITGVSANNISNKLNISRGEIKSLIEKFDEKFPGVQSFLKSEKERIVKEGFVKTILGRKWNVPGLDSQNRNIKTNAEKAALSYLIQAGAVDIIKKFMLDCFTGVLQGHRDIHLLVQLDNEFLFETRRRRAEKYINQIRTIMKDVLELKVPLHIRVYEGNNWFEMEEFLNFKTEKVTAQRR